MNKKIYHKMAPIGGLRHQMAQAKDPRMMLYRNAPRNIISGSGPALEF